ncbi:DUF4073 domain-containing protein [Pseudoneobacillus sp. C159]
MKKLKNGITRIISIGTIFTILLASFLQPVGNVVRADGFSAIEVENSAMVATSRQAALEDLAPALQPSVTHATTTEDTQTTSGLIIQPNNEAGSAPTNYYKITGITGGQLFKPNGVTLIHNADFITVAEGLAGLKFSPAPDMHGIYGFGFTVQAGPSNDGEKLSAPVDVMVTVTEVNDPPFAKDDLLSGILEGSGPIEIQASDLLANDLAGPFDEQLWQQLTVTSVDNPSGGTVQLVDSRIIFTPQAHFFGTAFFMYTVSDDGRTNGESDPRSTQAMVTFPIYPKADVPSITGTVTAEDTMSSNGLVIRRNPVDGGEVTHYKITGITGGTLYRWDGTTPIDNEQFITTAEGEHGLKFLPDYDRNSVAGDLFGFDVQAAIGPSDDGISDKIRAMITVTEVNDAPYARDDTTETAFGVPFIQIPFAELTANDRPGPPNESDQTLTITDVGNAVGGTVSITNGNVQFVINPGFLGTARFDYEITDNGTTNGTPHPLTDRATVYIDVKDLNKPVITLHGDETVYLLQGQNYIEPGYSAEDDVDGDLTAKVTISGSVSPMVLGKYTLLYNVKDSSNNAAIEQRRTVHVVSHLLSNLTLGSEVINFQPTQTDYTVDVLNSVEKLLVTPTLLDENSTVTVNGTVVNSGSGKDVSLNVGKNVITVVVTALGGTTKTYKVTVNRAPSANADLSNLVVSKGALTPDFAAGTLDYTVDVAHNVNQIELTPVVAEANATVTVNGNAAVSGQAVILPLAVGNNPISVVVTAQDGTTVKTYTITIKRAPSANADLSNLVVSKGMLTPGFAAGTLGYTVDVAHNVNQIELTPVVAEANATVTVNGNAAVSGQAVILPLAVGNNPISVVVTAQDGTTVKIYTVTVKRAPSANADLRNLVVSKGVLTPAFAAGTLDYTVDVAHNVSQIELTPVVAEANATVKVNGNAAVSGQAVILPLVVGVNPISVVVTAQDGTTVKTYTVTIKRAPSANADLSNLVVSKGALTPAFATGTLNYTVDVAHNVSQIELTPVVAEANATVTVNGNAAVSGQAVILPLAVGNNPISVVVTAQDGTTVKIYTVTVKRAPSANADLRNLVVSKGVLTPAFAAGTLDYTVDVAHNVSQIELTPVVAEANATVTVNGNAAVSGQAVILPLAVGNNPISVVVTAQDGTTVKTYTITIKRAPSANADLSNLVVNKGALTPDFAAGTLEYTVDVTNEVNQIGVTAVMAEGNASVKVNGTAAVSGNEVILPLVVGDNEVIITVTAQDGTTVKTYKVVVTRDLFHPQAPTVTADDVNNLIIGADATMEYSTNDGTTWTSYQSQPVPTFDGDRTVLVRVKAIEGVSTASPTTKLTFTANPVIVIPPAIGEPGRMISIVVVDAEGKSLPAGNLEIKRSTNEGQKVDTIKLDVRKILAAISMAVENKKNTIVVQMIDLANDPADKINVGVDKEVLALLTQHAMNLVIQTEKATITIPATTWTQVGNVDVTLTITNGQNQKQTEAAIEAKAKGTKVVGSSVKVNTNVKGRTEITLPIAKDMLPADPKDLPEFISSLAVFVEHSDGENKVYTGMVQYDEKGIPTGISIWVEKFSTFTVIAKPKASYSYADDAAISEYAKESVYRLQELGIMEGSQNQFNPQGAVTRAQFTKIILMALGMKVEGSFDQEFKDVKKDHWAFAYIMKAKELGIIKGVDANSFNPNAPITRQQMALMIGRALELKETTNTITFLDQNKISTEALPYVQALAQQGIIKGNNNHFNPQGLVTREMIATIIARVLEHVEHRDASRNVFLFIKRIN